VREREREGERLMVGLTDGALCAN